MHNFTAILQAKIAPEFLEEIPLDATHTLIEKLKTQPGTVEFDEVIRLISDHFYYTPARFSNGIGHDCVVNEAGSNEGSCKIFSFAHQHHLSKEETLACFGKFYRIDVLLHPQGTDHANIRTFMRHGWDTIRFDQVALQPK